MMPKKRNLRVSITVVLLVLVVGVLLYLQKNDQKKNTEEYKNDLVIQHSYLLKTKLALIEYQKLDENDPNIDTLKGQIKGRFDSSYDEGFENYNKLLSKYPNDVLLSKQEEIYQRQDIMETDEDEIIDYLVDLSDLLREYQLAIRNSQ